MEEKTELQGPKGLMTLGVMLAALMAFLDISIVNVALNDIRASFGTPLDQIGWVSTGYMVANVVVIPMTGFFQRRFGYKRYYVASIALFAVASALCGLAWNLPSLVAFRILQGCGGGAIIPTSNAILLSRYPRAQHGLASGLFGMGAVCGPLLGPTVGGWLIDVANWHWIFLVNLPIAAAAMFLSWKTIDQPEFKPSKAPPDRKGIVLLVVGMASLQYVLEEGHRDDWWESRTITVLAVVAAICALTFVFHELEAPNPVVDLRVFKDVNYAAGTAINFLLGIALFSGIYLSALYCGAIMRYNALTIGELTLGPGLLQFFLMPIIGKSAGKFDARRMLALGMTLMCVSLWINGHLTAQVDFMGLVRPNLFRFLSTGFLFIPLTVLTLSDLPPEKRGSATGLFNLTRELGGSFGTAMLGTLIDSRTKLHYSRIAEHVTPYDAATVDALAFLQKGLGRTWDAASAARGVIQLRMQQQALTWAFNDAFLAILAGFLAGFVFVVLMRKPRLVAAAGGH